MTHARDDDNALHQQAWALLPWRVNGSLDADEHDMVSRHMAHCPACTTEAMRLQQMQTAIQSEDDNVAVTQGLARLRQRIAPATAPIPWWQRMWRDWQTSRAWLRAAVALQSGLIAAMLLGVALNMPEQGAVNAQAPAYRTLSAAPAQAAPSAHITVIFGDAVSQGELRALLTTLQAQVVDGPTPEGAYVLALPAMQQLAALARLRQLPRQTVLFAEPSGQLGTAGSPP
jgi:hypothetical protein